MDVNLSDAEMRVMEILWNKGPTRATYIADTAREQVGWEKNTTYTFLHRLIKKGAVRRTDPGFYCEAAFDRELTLSTQARGLVEKTYNGSLGLFVRSFLDGGSISQAEKEQLLEMIDRYEKKEIDPV